MDLFSILHQDHEHLRELLRQMEDLPWEETGPTQSLFDVLDREYSSHSRAETEVLYPRLKAFRQAEWLARDGLRAHRHLDACLQQMRCLPPSDERWHLFFEELKNDLREHIDDEEDFIFKKLRNLFSESQRAQLAGQLIQAKQRALAA